MCVCFRPLRKMAAGMIFAALAFGAATLVEVNVVVRMSSGRESDLLSEDTHQHSPTHTGLHVCTACTPSRNT